MAETWQTHRQVFVLLAMVFIAMMPLNEARMAIIRRKLRARDEGVGS